MTSRYFQYVKIHKGCMLNSTICEVKKENTTKTSPSPSVLFLLITSYHPHQHRHLDRRVLASIAPVISSIGSHSCNCVLWEWRRLLGKENWNVCCLFVHEIMCSRLLWNYHYFLLAQNGPKRDHEGPGKSTAETRWLGFKTKNNDFVQSCCKSVLYLKNPKKNVPGTRVYSLI